jgi:large subunit ribosomal protein L30
MAAKLLRITQTGSVIGRTQDQRAAVRTLGLHRIRHTVVQPDRPEIRGMLRKVGHLVTFEEVTAEQVASDAEVAARLAARNRPVITPGTGPKPAPKAARSKAAAAAPSEDDAAEVTADPAAAAEAPAKKAPAKKAAAKKTPAKESAAKKTAAKKAPAKKTPAKKTAAKKTATKKAKD